MDFTTRCHFLPTQQQVQVQFWVRFPWYSRGMAGLMGWSCTLWNRFYKAFKIPPCKFAKMCHKINSNGSPPALKSEQQRGHVKHFHMEGAAQRLHMASVLRIQSAPTIQTPLTGKRPFPVSEAVCLVMFLTCPHGSSAPMIVAHHGARLFLIGLECG